MTPRPPKPPARPAASQLNTPPTTRKVRRKDGGTWCIPCSLPGRSVFHLGQQPKEPTC